MDNSGILPSRFAIFRPRLNKRRGMPERETLRRAEQDKREGKAPSTQAGDFVREEIHHIREGKHGGGDPRNNKPQELL
jgi:hypothetical protein